MPQLDMLERAWLSYAARGGHRQWYFFDVDDDGDRVGDSHRVRVDKKRARYPGDPMPIPVGRLRAACGETRAAHSVVLVSYGIHHARRPDPNAFGAGARAGTRAIFRPCLDCANKS